MYDDLAKRLRYCGNAISCIKCPYQYDCGGSKELLINAADAIEELQTYVDLYKDLTEESQRVARKVIDKYPQWIPVTVRLPEIGENVLLYAYGRVHFGRLLFLEINLGHPTFLMEQSGLQHAPVLETTTKGRITHWQPLPEPPKEET